MNTFKTFLVAFCLAALLIAGVFGFLWVLTVFVRFGETYLGDWGPLIGFIVGFSASLDLVVTICEYIQERYRKPAKKSDLADLVDRITPDNSHPEIKL